MVLFLATIDSVSIQNVKWFCLRVRCLHQVQQGGGHTAVGP